MSSLFPDTPETPDTIDHAYTVSELNRDARALLEGTFPEVLVEGEISNLARPASGHWYFTLKDSNAQVRCAMFRNRNMLVRMRVEDGQKVRLKGRLSIYENRGDYQLIVSKMESRGDGALQQAFEELKRKLLREGLFDDAHKQPLPAHIRHLGVITSPTGAAIRDILSTLRRRFPAIRITILPVSVQGGNSARGMIHALELANARQGCLRDIDALVIGRGGGSLEDLWSFNDESLARAIFDSELPVVSAVGHEVDFTIADFVADMRAATPTAAAELLSPDQSDYLELFQAYARQFAAQMLQRIAQSQQQLVLLQKQLKHPGRRLQDQAQALDELEARLRRAFRNELYRAGSNLRQLQERLRLNSPERLLGQYGKELVNSSRNLHRAMQAKLEQSRQALVQQSRNLNTVSPLATLSRGYSITLDDNGNVLRDANAVKAGDRLRTRLHEGELISIVEKS